MRLLGLELITLLNGLRMRPIFHIFVACFLASSDSSAGLEQVNLRPLSPPRSRPVLGEWDNVLVCSLSDGSATYNRCFDRSTFFVQKLPFVMLARRFELKNVGVQAVQGDGCLTFEPATCQDVVVMSYWQFHEDHCRRSPEQE